ncbi:MAG TPA: hypothetical protein VM689_05585 [Aliidongia sp.]|nr:hypothetical protein [Aliidongia sp.]
MSDRKDLIGRSFRATGKTFQSLPTATWTVTTLFTGQDGLAYVRLVNDGDRSRIKSVSVSALTDQRLFVMRTDRG